MLKSYFKWI